MTLSRGHSRAWLALQCLVLAAALIPFFQDEVPSGLDVSSHLAEAERVSQAWRAGDLDLWFEAQNLGYPLFRAYPPLLALVLGTLIAIFGKLVSALLILKLLIATLILALPCAVYRGLRWLGSQRRYALLAAALSLSIADRTGFGLSLAAVGGLGLLAQLLGLVLTPLALGALGRPGRLRAGLLLSLVLLAHPYCAVLTGAAALTTPRARRALPGALAFALVFAAFWWVPALVYRAEVGGFPWPGPAELGLDWDALSAIFDDQRWPWFAALVVAGIALSLLRSRTSPRGLRGAVLLLGGSLLVAGAGPLLGPDAQPLRAVLGIHWAGLCLAAAALDAGVALTAARLPLPLLVILTALSVDSSVRVRDTLRSLEPDPDGLALCRALAAGEGRIWAHERYFSGHPWYRNELPRCAARPGLASRGRGFHDTLLSYYAETFTPSGPLLRLFEVRSIVTVGDAPLEQRWLERQVVGDHRIYQAKERFGHSALVRSPYALRGPARALRALVSGQLERAFAAGLLPELSGGEDTTDPATAATALERALAEGGSITSSITTEARRGPGDYAINLAIDAADGPLYAVLKAGYFSGWEATLDGRAAPVVTLAPGLPAVAVGPGTHRLELRFQRPRWEKALYVSDAALLGLAAALLLRRRRRGCTSWPGTARPNDAPPG